MAANLSMVYLVNKCAQFKRVRFYIGQSEINKIKNTWTITNPIFGWFNEPFLLAAKPSKRSHTEAMGDNTNGRDRDN